MIAGGCLWNFNNVEGGKLLSLTEGSTSIQKERTANEDATSAEPFT